MSQLKTHDIDDLNVVSRTNPNDPYPREPGQFVRHVDFDYTFGTVVAIDDTQASVLWSKPPIVVDVGTYSTGSTFVQSGYVFAPYVPLVVTPTIFDPTAFATGSIARYSKKRINPGFFVTGSIV